MARGGPPFDRAAFEADYRGGLSVNKLALKHDISKSTTRARLDRLGLREPTANRKPRRACLASEPEAPEPKVVLVADWNLPPGSTAGVFW